MPNNPSNSTRDVIVIGAGVSGLACAHRLRGHGLDVQVLESSSRPGGVIRSETIDGFVMEFGPNTYRRNEETEELVQELGLSDDYQPKPLLETPRFVCDGSRLIEVPMGPVGLALTPIMPFWGKARMLLEPFMVRRPGKEESVADFIRRHGGNELLKRLIEPLVSGIYAGDPEKISMPAAFPLIWSFAEAKGSIVRGAASHFRKLRKQRAAAAAANGGKPRMKSALCSFRTGLSQLTDSLAERLGDALRCESKVCGLEVLPGEGNGYRVSATDSQGNESTVDARSVVLAAPAGASADLVEPILPGAVDDLRSIPYTPVAIAHVGMPLDSLQFEPRGFGFLVQRGTPMRALGVLFTSALYEGRAPAGQALLTIFYGGATDPAILEETDEAFEKIVRNDLERSVGWDGRSSYLSVTRFDGALPAYALGHLDRVERIDAAASQLPAPLRFVGNYLRRISLPDCAQQAYEKADEVASILNA